MTNRLAATCLVSALTISHPAFARTGHCVLQVKGHTYLNGPCNIERDPDGSFTIGVNEKKRPRHFAYVNLAPDGAHGSWNAEPYASHAHDDLGFLKRDGACWKNATARVCAFR